MAVKLNNHLFSHDFPVITQADQMDCGPTCLKMVLKHFKLDRYPLSYLRELCKTNKSGTSIENMQNALEELGFKAEVDFITSQNLSKIDLPAILFVDNGHFIVLHKIKNSNYYIVDPSIGAQQLSITQLAKRWHLSHDKGISLIIEKRFEEVEQLNQVYSFQKTTSFSSLYRKLFKFKKGIQQVLFILLLGALIQLTIPFLTQAIVDTGINNQDIQFIYLILIAQLMLFVGSTAIDFLRSWILLHIGIRINIDLIVSFVWNLLRQSTLYFDRKKEGDILQRVIDNNRIEHFLTDTTVSLLIAVINLVLFGIVLLIYDLTIFLIFIASSIFLIAWISFFLKKRKTLDNERFDVSSKNRSELIEVINGIEEIKINNLETERLKSWKDIQIQFLKVRLKMLQLGQFQRGGAFAINQGKNILITFFSATAVLEGSMTLGAMLAIQYIVGQLNAPVRDIVSFIQNQQDAQLSLERISDVKEIALPIEISNKSIQYEGSNKLDVSISNVSFQHNGKVILDDVSLEIPYGNTIGIVGQSGSGKTSLLKMLLKLNKPDKGIIKAGSIDIANANSQIWRNNISAVMQDGYIFSNSLAYNIALQDDNHIDYEKLNMAIESSCLKEIVTELPLGINTKIGRGGKRLSKGQIQRILIARAFYKNGDYILLDEFTSSLDNITEKTIINNVRRAFKGKTVVIVAHKIDTIIDADLIVFMKDGKIVEKGKHQELIDQRSTYYNLLSFQANPKSINNGVKRLK